MNYQGYLLAAHPRRRDPTFRSGVVLVVKHNERHCLGLQINKEIVDSIDIQTIMENSMISGDLDGPVFWGGPEFNTRVTVIHSLDWISSNTSKITNGIGISNDTSILTALADGRGPKQWRAVLGHVKWADGELEGEISGDAPWAPNDTWNYCLAEPKLIFDYRGAEQWRKVITTSASLQVNQWFA